MSRSGLVLQHTDAPASLDRNSILARFLAFTRSSQPAKTYPALVRYAVTLTSLALALTINTLLAPYVKTHPQLAPITGMIYLLSFCGSAWWGGYGPGILVTTVGILSISFLRTGHWIPQTIQPVQLSMVYVICLTMSWLAATRKRVEEVLVRTNEQLEMKVRERTAELEETNETLQNRLAELETVYGKMVVGLCLLDTSLRFVRINEKFASINGAPLEAHLGRTLREMVSPPVGHALDPLARRVLATCDPVLDHELSGPSPEGGERFWSVACAPVKTEEGSVLGLQVIVQDVTDRKLAARALSEANNRLRQANRDLEQFAYSASHDLQEPLRMVSVYSQMLQKKFGDKLGGQGEEYLKYTVTGASRMQQLLRDLLTYSETSTLDSEPAETADANEALTRALSNLQIAIEQSNARVTPAHLPLVRIPAIHLVQLFQNLVSNAIKYRGKEPPHIVIGAERNGDEWLISIADNGIGIDSKYKEQIFGIFKRLHSADEYSGTGIGLAICHRIVERSGGRIWVESQPGKGSTFFFTVPDSGGA